MSALQKRWSLLGCGLLVAIQFSAPVAVASGKDKKVSSARRPASIVGDDVDAQKEKRFHDIYKSYNSQPTPSEGWNKVISEKNMQAYTIQKGDTLSGLSRTLFGDPFYWPKLWSQNTRSIQNPHEVLPGMELHFIPGTATSAPSLSVGEKLADNSDAQNGEDKIKMDSSGSGKSPAKIPSSLPGYKFQVPKKFNADFEAADLTVQHQLPQLQMSYYLSESPIEGMGFVEESQLGLKTANEFQYVYVKFPGEPSEKHYTVVRNLELLSDPYTSKSVNIIETQGELEVIEPVNAEEHLYRAMVTKVIHPVEVGSVLLAGKMPRFKTERAEVAGKLNARIIGGQFSHTRSLFGTGSIVFINLGSESGVAVDQGYEVYANLRSRNVNTLARENDTRIASIRIISVTPHFATAYVIKSFDDINIGDHLGAASTLSGQEEESLKDKVESTAHSKAVTSDKEQIKEEDDSKNESEAVPDASSLDLDGGSSGGNPEQGQLPTTEGGDVSPSAPSDSAVPTDNPPAPEDDLSL